MHRNTRTKILCHSFVLLDGGSFTILNMNHRSQYLTFSKWHAYCLKKVGKYFKLFQSGASVT